VWERVPAARLVIAGARRAETEAVERGVAALPPDRRERVRLEIDVPEARKAELYASFDVFASPSVYESFGITFLEAWAAGLPVVACDVGAVGSVIEHGADGLLVPPSDPRALAEALVRLLLDPAERRRLGERGRLVAVERHGWDAVAAQVEALYASLAGTAATGA
jgi:glycosyltransferase involved in cell wall biosynthesis